MRALLPYPAEDVDLEAAYATSASNEPDRPFVRVNMITSLDGAIAVKGRSGALGGAPDRRLFKVLRGLADMILVGAGTFRAESYGPARIDELVRNERRTRGQSDVAPIAVVTRSCNLDWSSPFFTEATARPVVITTTTADRSATARAASVADVITEGDDRVDLSAALRALAERGALNVLCEGGPGLNAQLATAGLLDELCLTVSPTLVGGTGPRLLGGPELADPLQLRAAHVFEEDGFYFLRLHADP